MKKLLILLIIALSGCAFDSPFVKTETIVEYKYIVRTALDQQKTKPAYPKPIDVKTATQLDLANWIKQTEERQYRLEAIIDELVKYYEKPVSASEAASATSNQKK